MGLRGLVVAGVNELESQDEIDEVCSLICSRGYKNPLGRSEEKLQRVNRCAFFRLAAKREYENKSVEDLIKML